MTTREEIPYAVGAYQEPAEWDWPQHSVGDFPPDPPGDSWHDGYDDTYDDTFVHWDDPEPAVRRPWHRNAGILIGLIAASSTALSVAFVLLVTGGPSVDSPARLRPAIRSSAVEAPPAEPAKPSETAAADDDTANGTETDTAPADEPTEEAAAEAPEAHAPAPPADEPAPAPAPRDSSADKPNGPRINVTRNPMSFTPGSIN